MEPKPESNLQRSPADNEERTDFPKRVQPAGLQKPITWSMAATVLAVLGPTIAVLFNWASQSSVNSCTGDYCGIGLGIGVFLTSVAIFIFFFMASVICWVISIRKREHGSGKISKLPLYCFLITILVVGVGVAINTRISNTRQNKAIQAVNQQLKTITNQQNEQISNYNTDLVKKAVFSFYVPSAPLAGKTVKSLSMHEESSTQNISLQIAYQLSKSDWAYVSEFKVPISFAPPKVCQFYNLSDVSGGAQNNGAGCTSSFVSSGGKSIYRFNQMVSGDTSTTEAFYYVRLADTLISMKIYNTNGNAVITNEDIGNFIDSFVLTPPNKLEFTTN